MADYDKEFAQWYEEDAARLNEMCRVAYDSGHVVPVGVPLPPLDKDGVEMGVARKSLVEIIKRRGQRAH